MAGGPPGQVADVSSLGPAGPVNGQAPTDTAGAEAVAGWFVRIVALVVLAGGLYGLGVGLALGAPPAAAAGAVAAVGGAALLRWSWSRRGSERAATHGRPLAD